MFGARCTTPRKGAESGSSTFEATLQPHGRLLRFRPLSPDGGRKTGSDTSHRGGRGVREDGSFDLEQEESF